MAGIQIFLIKAVLFVFKWLPESLCIEAGRFLGLLWFYVIRYRRKLVLRNLKKAFKDEKSDKEIYDIARNNFIHYGISFAEFLRLPALSLRDIESKTTITGTENLNRALEKNKGLIVICGHYGNWDMLAIAQSLLGYNGYIITRRAKNKSVDRFWQKIRENKGVRFLPDRNSIFSILRLLKNNEKVGIIFDQHAGEKMGVRVNFFGRPAWTMKAVALLVMKTGCPVIPAFMWRDKGHHYFEAGPEIPFTPCETSDEAIKVNTQKYNDILESFIRKHPAQWLWIHRRWK